MSIRTTSLVDLESLSSVAGHSIRPRGTRVHRGMERQSDLKWTSRQVLPLDWRFTWTTLNGCWLLRKDNNGCCFDRRVNNGWLNRCWLEDDCNGHDYTYLTSMREILPGGFGSTNCPCPCELMILYGLQATSDGRTQARRCWSHQRPAKHCMRTPDDMPSGPMNESHV